MSTKAITGDHASLDAVDGNFDNEPLGPVTLAELRDFVLALDHEHCHWDLAGKCDGVCDCYLSDILERLEDMWPGSTPLYRGRDARSSL